MNTYKLTHTNRKGKTTTIEIHGTNLAKAVDYYIVPIRVQFKDGHHTDITELYRLSNRGLTSCNKIANRQMLKQLKWMHYTVEVVEYAGGWFDSKEYYC